MKVIVTVTIGLEHKIEQAKIKMQLGEGLEIKVMTTTINRRQPQEIENG